MLENEIGNFQENIHAVDYEKPYLEKLIQGSVMTDFDRPAESLNGKWHFGIDQYDTCLRAKWYQEDYYDEDGRQFPVDFSFDSWKTMSVPSCWNMYAPELFLYESSIVYTRTFRYENHGEERAFIKFGGVSHRAYVFVNGQFMGMHIGASTPFSVEVTDVLKTENRIIVVANNTRRRTNVPCENTDWFNYGGIYRDVSLLRLPGTFIERASVQLVPDGYYNRIAVEVTLNDCEKSGIGRLQIPELWIAADITVENGVGKAVIAANPQLWSPENPKLYDVEVTFGNDRITDRVGFREIRVEGTDIRLNGQSIFLRGISAHEESVVNGKAISEAEIRENFRLAKEMNCNYMRLAHYPHTELAARIADEVGMLLWQEIPVYWAIAFENPAVYADAENQLSELVLRDQNRASVIIWSVGNENADTNARLDFMKSLVAAARALDSTRLISAACLVNHTELVIEDRLAEFVDIIGINEYYGWYEPDFSKLPRIFDNSKPQKPIVISEFGAGARQGNHGTRDEKFTEECQLDVYQQQIATLRNIPYVRGLSPWILYDFRCPRRVNSIQDYYNRKGLLSEDKAHKKLAFFSMQAFYDELKNMI